MLNETVESMRGDGCEVVLFHHEDMGIPWEIAKFGVRQGMWGTVKNIERGFRAYQKYRATGGAISRCAFMAQINTKLDLTYLRSSESELLGSVDDDKPGGGGLNIPKLLLISGAVAVACTLHPQILPYSLLVQAAKRLANIGRRARL